MTSDEQLARAGDERSVEELLRRYDRLIRSEARRFFASGMGREDFEQEARIAFVAAVRAWDGRGRFQAFACTVVRRRLVTALRAARATPRIANELAAERVFEDGEELHPLDVLPCPRPGPLESVLVSEQLWSALRVADGLSSLERYATIGVAFGWTYSELEGVDRGRDARRIDNAVQRGMAKLRKAA